MFISVCLSDNLSTQNELVHTIVYYSMFYRTKVFHLLNNSVFHCWTDTGITDWPETGRMKTEFNYNCSIEQFVTMSIDVQANLIGQTN